MKSPKPSYFIPGNDNATRHQYICWIVETQGIPYEIAERDLTAQEASFD